MSASHSLIDGFTIYNIDDLINVSPPATNVTVRNMYSSGATASPSPAPAGPGATTSSRTPWWRTRSSEPASRAGSARRATCATSPGATSPSATLRTRSTSSRTTSTRKRGCRRVSMSAWSRTRPTSPGRTLWARRVRVSGMVAVSVIPAGALRWVSLAFPPVYRMCQFLTPVADESTEKGIYLLCADADHCKDFHFKNIDLKAYVGFKAA